MKKYLVIVAAFFYLGVAYSTVPVRTFAECAIDNQCKGVFDGDFFQICNGGCLRDSDNYGVNNRKEREAKEAQRLKDEELKRAQERARKSVEKAFPGMVH